MSAAVTTEGDHRRFDAVIFDFGGVFIDSPFAVLDRAAASFGIPAALLSEVVFGSYEEDTDHPWHRLERGEMTLDEGRAAITRLAEEHGLPETDPFVLLAELAAGGTPAVRPFMVEAVRTFRRAGLRTGVLTNNVRELGSFWRTVIPLDELFHDVLDSSEVGIRKPDPAVFELACRRLGVDPGRSLFVDDHEGNVAGARRAGLTAVCCGYSEATTRRALASLVELAGI